MPPKVILSARPPRGPARYAHSFTRQVLPRDAFVE